MPESSFCVYARYGLSVSAGVPAPCQQGERAGARGPCQRSRGRRTHGTGLLAGAPRPRPHPAPPAARRAARAGESADKERGRAHRPARVAPLARSVAPVPSLSALRSGGIARGAGRTLPWQTGWQETPEVSAPARLPLHSPVRRRRHPSWAPGQTLNIGRRLRHSASCQESSYAIRLPIPLPEWRRTVCAHIGSLPPWVEGRLARTSHPPGVTSGKLGPHYTPSHGEALISGVRRHRRPSPSDARHLSHQASYFGGKPLA